MTIERKPKETQPKVEILLSEERIKRRVSELAKEIVEDYRGREFVLVGVLKGASFFLVDLAREIGRLGVSPKLAFVGKSSYGMGTESSGVVESTFALDTKVANEHVVIVEDIVDSGHTLSALLDEVDRHQPASLKTCVFLDKEERREAVVPLDFVGFKIPNVFVVGYGLDADEKERCRPHIGFISTSPASNT